MSEPLHYLRSLSYTDHLGQLHVSDDLKMATLPFEFRHAADRGLETSMDVAATGRIPKFLLKGILPDDQETHEQFDQRFHKLCRKISHLSTYEGGMDYISLTELNFLKGDPKIEEAFNKFADQLGYKMAMNESGTVLLVKKEIEGDFHLKEDGAERGVYFKCADGSKVVASMHSKGGMDLGKEKELNKGLRAELGIPGPTPIHRMGDFNDPNRDLVRDKDDLDIDLGDPRKGKDIIGAKAFPATLKPSVIYMTSAVQSEGDDSEEQVEHLKCSLVDRHRVVEVDGHQVIDGMESQIGCDPSAKLDPQSEGLIEGVLKEKKAHGEELKKTKEQSNEVKAGLVTGCKRVLAEAKADLVNASGALGPVKIQELKKQYMSAWVQAACHDSSTLGLLANKYAGNLTKETKDKVLEHTKSGGDLASLYASDQPLAETFVDELVVRSGMSNDFERLVLSDYEISQVDPKGGAAALAQLAEISRTYFPKKETTKSAQPEMGLHPTVCQTTTDVFLDKVKEIVAAAPDSEAKKELFDQFLASPDLTLMITNTFIEEAALGMAKELFGPEDPYVLDLKEKFQAVLDNRKSFAEQQTGTIAPEYKKKGVLEKSIDGLKKGIEALKALGQGDEGYEEKKEGLEEAERGLADNQRELDEVTAKIQGAQEERKRLDAELKSGKCKSTVRTTISEVKDWVAEDPISKAAPTPESDALKVDLLNTVRDISQARAFQTPGVAPVAGIQVEAVASSAAVAPAKLPALAL